jgi:UDP-N-acetylglucosamine:LPS N-acetylglucosamine transferase
MPQSGFSAATLSGLLAEVLADPGALALAATNARHVATPDAANALATLVEEMAGDAARGRMEQGARA